MDQIYNILLIVIFVLNLTFNIILLIMLIKGKNSGFKNNGYDIITDERRSRELINEIEMTVKEKISDVVGYIGENQKIFSEAQNQKIAQLDRHINQNQQLSMNSITNSLLTLEERFKTLSFENERKLADIRQTVENQLLSIQSQNNAKLDEMRSIVDQKLQSTLEEKMTKSFSMVSERLEQVYKGLGEMQTLASGVGDLKKILSNVKTRGTLGEVQLGTILKEILSSDQYDENVSVVSGSRDVVEYGIKLPASDEGFIYLPIDSKLPLDTFYNYREALENGDKDEIKRTLKVLETVIKTEAKTISQKYINPPDTTNFAIMFLPFESLYAQVVDMGLLEVLQREYKISVAGPGTMAALLNSLQMGFKTLSVQRHSTEVYKILDSIKTEFDKFELVLESTQQRLDQANKELDTLVGVRTRKIQKTLNSLSAYKEIE